MTTPDAITIILDDVDWDVSKSDISESAVAVAANPPNAVYPCKYNNTITLFDLLEGSQVVPLSAFDGSTIQLYGIAPPPQFNQTFIIQTPPELYTYHAPGYGGLHYTSPPNMTNSVLFFSQAQGFAFDYAVVTVYPTTNLLGTTILVDDSSSSLIWHGSWTEENNFTLPVGCVAPVTPTFKGISKNFTDFTADMAPHANTTHVSQTKGDQFEFWFTGTSILVYGITPLNLHSSSPSWLLQMSFTLDTAEPIMVNITSQDSESVYEQPHVVYFNASSIPAGQHTLVGEIVDVVGSTALPPRENRLHNLQAQLCVSGRDACAPAFCSHNNGHLVNNDSDLKHIADLKFRSSFG
ncbi:hypothetical protein C8F01DRAFT_337648 [Mycena amicta]|nr:hypothetical protein C8F01DRAFT_337648 [Mycena amicta]